MYIDLHSHLIYGVDDGASSFTGTEKMIRQAVDNHISAIITTPHITPGQVPFPMDKYLAHLDEARTFLSQEGIDLRLYTGSEVLYSYMTPAWLREGRIPTLAGTRFVLVEFSPDDEFSHLVKAVGGVASAGYVPVIAHAERYMCLKKPAHILALREEANARIQINARTVVKKHPFFRERFIRRILEEGLVDYIGTDCHDMPGRENCMEACAARLRQDLGEEYALTLVRDNALKLLSESKE